MAKKTASKRKSLKAKDLSARGDQAKRITGGGVGPCFGKGKSK